MSMIIRTRVAIAGICFLTIAFLLCEQTIAAQCETDPKVRETLRRVDLTVDDSGYALSRERKLNQLRALVKQFPKELAVHEHYQDTALTGDFDHSALIEEYRQLLSQHTSDSFYLYLYGRVLIGQKTSEAKTLLEQALAANPQFALSHLRLVEVYQTRQFNDEQQRLQHLNAFFEQCPESLRAYRYLRGLNDPELLRVRTARLRELLYARTNLDDFSYFSLLWDLEFRITPQSQHSSVRTRLSADLKHLRQLQAVDKESWLQTLSDGYNQVGDNDGIAWTENQILKLLPHSNLALKVTRERWQKTHPEPDDTSNREQYYRALLSATDRWIRLWPHSYMSWLKRLDAIKELSNVAPVEVERIADNMLRITAENAGGFRTTPPVSLLIAELYVKHNVRLARVPDLVRAGLTEMDQSRARDSQFDQRSPEEIKYTESTFKIITSRSLLMLVDVHLRLKQPAEAHRVLDEMASNLERNKPAETSNDKYFEAKYWESKARLAEVENKKQEALAYYKQARTIAPPEEASNKDKPNESNGWQPQDVALPDFKLDDLSGRSWQLTDLRGKVVFINIWATWCKPCQDELRLVQALYDRLKDRPDVLVLTLNVDTDVGLIDPFMKSRRFSFPVLAAHDYVQRLRPDAVLPRNWLVSRNGILQLERVGFDPQTTDWQKQVLDLIEKPGL